MGSIEAPNKFNIIIIGAGIAGLTAALGLHQKGHNVSVFERHADTQALGGPINLSPSATHILSGYGLEEELVHERLGLDERPISFRRFEDGSALATTPVGTAKKIFGSGVWTASRFGYQKIFKQIAEERGKKIEFSAPIQTVDVDTATVILRDGRKFEADLVVAADDKSLLHKLNGSILTAQGMALIFVLSLLTNHLHEEILLAQSILMFL